MNDFTMPLPPPMYGAPYGQAGYAYDMNGNMIQAQTYAPQPVQQQYYQQPYPPQQPMAPQAQPNTSLGLDFSGLIGSNVAPLSVGPVAVTEVASTSKRKRKKKEEDMSTTEVEVVDNNNEKVQMVEAISYADTYQDTNLLLRGAIAQADELANNLKVELDIVRAANPKQLRGKYTYIANLTSALNGVISTKVTAIREINSSIRNINDAEYRRYKDMRSANADDDVKFIADLYNSYIHTPVGTLPGQTQYQLPSTLDITAGLNGVVPVDSISQDQRDAGFNSFMTRLTPEQNMMINAENNPDVKEVIVYDQMTGQKYFEWRNLRTGEALPNLPKTDPMFMEDFAIDPRTRTAKNVNLHVTMPVVYINEGVMNEY